VYLRFAARPGCGAERDREAMRMWKRAAAQSRMYLLAVASLGLAILGMAAFLIWTAVAPSGGASGPEAGSTEPGADGPVVTSPSSPGSVEPPVGALPDSLEPTAELPVLHVKRIIHGMNAGPELADRSPIIEERWLDTETGNGRSVIMRQDGTVRSIGVVNGNTHSGYAYWDNYLKSNVYAEGDPELDAMKWDLWSYREGLDQGVSAPFVTTVIRGVRALQFQQPVLGESSGFNDIFLDERTKLPITEIYNEETGDGSVTTRRIDYEYLLVELLPKEALTPEMLEVPAPPEANKDIVREMTVADAEAFHEYDIYYLGEAFENLSLVLIHDYEGRSSIVPEIRRVVFIYTPPLEGGLSPEHLYLTNEPLELSLLDLLEGGEEVSIGQQQAWWYEGNRHLRMKLGGTALTISGERDQVLRAVDALIKANQ
jgi:hypothetical protein